MLWKRWLNASDSSDYWAKASAKQEKRGGCKKNERKVCSYAKISYLCTRLTAHEVDSLAQQVEHIPFKDGVLGSSPKRITEKKESL